MIKRHLLSIAAVSVALLAFSATAILAQEETPTVVPMPDATEAAVPPPSFTDGRINGSISLGGLALYCVDKNNNTHVTSFQNGSITVWGIGDQKYINLTANQLRGNVEVQQAPSVMVEQMTEEAMTSGDATMMPTEEMMEPEVTAMPMGDQPILLAQALTPNGLIGFFTFGGDEFSLQGHDETGKFFTYTWTGCSTGSIDTTTQAYLPELEAVATVEFPAFATEEATPAS